MGRREVVTRDAGSSLKSVLEENGNVRNEGATGEGPNVDAEEVKRGMIPLSR